MLDENEGEVAVVLWQVLQDVTLWARTPADDRGPELFNDEVGDIGEHIPDLRLDVETLSVLVRDSHADSGPIIASVCERIASWAEERGRTGTALSFVQAAALTDQQSPRYAHQVAKQARRRADFARASVWYRRAIVLARRAGDWEIEARCYGGLGILQWQLGNRGKALEFQERVIRIARRFRLREVRADALFDMAVLNYEMGNPQAGLAAAEQALRLYGPGHAQVPLLIENIAVCWMDYRGAFREALVVLKELLVQVFRPAERIRLLANFARAAAGAGERALFETAWAEATARLGEDSAHENTADALLVLARGARLIGDLARVEMACGWAMSLATARQEVGVYLEAATLLAQARQGSSSPQDEKPAPEEQGEAAGRAGALDKLLAAIENVQAARDEPADVLAAVFSEPDNPVRAYELGMIFRQQARFSSASIWFERARILAERAGEWKTAAESLMRLANLKRQSGDLEGAAALSEQARELARRFGYGNVEGAALHDLCIVRFEHGLGVEGFVLAREAISAYEPGSTGIAKIAHDVAVFMMQSRGDCANALTVFRELENHTFGVSDQLLLWGNIARAAAGAGEMLVFERAWEEARLLIERMGADQEHQAAALINLGYGALAAGQVGWAETVAYRARELAASRGETSMFRFTEELLQAAAFAKSTRVRLRPLRDPSHDLKDAGRLARQLVSALRARGCRGQGSHAPAAPLQTRSLQ